MPSITLRRRHPSVQATSFFVVACSLFVCLSSNAQLLRAEGTRIVNDKGENVLLRGIGLGGWMLQEGYMMHFNSEGQQHRIRAKIQEVVGAEKTKQFYDAWLNNHTRRIDVDSLKAWGFNSIRLPMHFELYTLHSDQEPVAGQNTWLEKGFAMTDSLLAWCKANQVYLILDLHAAPGGQGNDLNISDRDPSKPSLWDSKADQQKTIALWRKLAERYVNEPWIGGYDIINEPNWGFSDLANDKNGTKEKVNAPLGQLLKDITMAIREVDQKHLVILEGNGWGNNYSGIEPTWDKNMALSFHKYWNYNDTASIRNMLALREKYQVPIWLGETGENSNVWFTDAIRLFESNNMGWAWWPLKKIGGNNPEEILSNPDYDALTTWVSGRRGDTGKMKTTPKPDAGKTFTGLMKLAENAKLENTVIHRDVLDAMFRQPFSTKTIPFKQHLIGKNTFIEAADYDLGRNGYAYYDKDTANFRVAGDNSVGNRGRVYRNDGVDIFRDSTRTGKYYVGSTEDGEWLQYTVSVARKGNYALTVKTAGSGELLVDVNGKHSSIVLSDSKTYVTSKPIRIDLAAGEQVIRLRIIRGGFKLQGISVQ